MGRHVLFSHDHSCSLVTLVLHGLLPLASSMYWAIKRSWFARVNALCNLSRKQSREVAAQIPNRFLSRRCFTLCITVEAETYCEAVQMPILLQLQNVPWKGDGG